MQDVIAIFDAGKTNKKLVLFDEAYNLVFEEQTVLQEVTDEDGFPCEDLAALTEWVKRSYQSICNNTGFNIKAVNFSAYGASFVYIDEEGQPLLPLYNYLKPYPQQLSGQFYNSYGLAAVLARETASPVLGSLNSGMQLYRVKYQQPEVFQRIRYALHLPQYLSYVLSGNYASEITSVGCHTQLWNFQAKAYHQWVAAEGLDKKLPPFQNGGEVHINADQLPVGTGLHDSSAALIPYLVTVEEPFMLLSTGTWCITLNPFNTDLLTGEELLQDCLCYLSFKGNPVKASRLFAGNEHEHQVKRLASHFQLSAGFYKSVIADAALIHSLQKENNTISQRVARGGLMGESSFAARELHQFEDVSAAYHQLIADLVDQQVSSTNLVCTRGIKKLFVDGGFSQNEIYMKMMAAAFPALEVYAAAMAQASALGAALVIHPHWNKKPVPPDLVQLRRYEAPSAYHE